MGKIIVNSDMFGKHFLTEEHENKIKETAGSYEVIFAKTKEDVDKNIKDAEILATFPMTFTGVSGADNLKWIQSFSAGVEAYLPDVRESDIILSNASGVHPVPISEHVIGMMLYLERDLGKIRDQQRDKKWAKVEELSELEGKTVIVAGLGKIGSRIARLCKAFEMKVIGIRNDVSNKPEFVDEVYTSEEMDHVLPEADYIILALPSTNETEKFLNEDRFNKMKNTARVLNIGRGTAIDEKALIRALEEKKIAGAALDVFEKEPLPENSPLWNMENVIVSPHVSGWSGKYMDRAVEIFCKNLEAYKKGENMPTLVDKTRGY